MFLCVILAVAMGETLPVYPQSSENLISTEPLEVPIRSFCYWEGVGGDARLTVDDFEALNSLVGLYTRENRAGGRFASSMGRVLAYMRIDKRFQDEFHVHCQDLVVILERQGTFICTLALARFGLGPEPMLYEDLLSKYKKSLRSNLERSVTAVEIYPLAIYLLLANDCLSGDAIQRLLLFSSDAIGVTTLDALMYSGFASIEIYAKVLEIANKHRNRSVVAAATRALLFVQPEVLNDSVLTRVRAEISSVSARPIVGTQEGRTLYEYPKASYFIFDAQGEALRFIEAYLAASKATRSEMECENLARFFYSTEIQELLNRHNKDGFQFYPPCR